MGKVVIRSQPVDLRMTRWPLGRGQAPRMAWQAAGEVHQSRWRWQRQARLLGKVTVVVRVARMLYVKVGPVLNNMVNGGR